MNILNILNLFFLIHKIIKNKILIIFLILSLDDLFLFLFKINFVNINLIEILLFDHFDFGNLESEMSMDFRNSLIEWFVDLLIKNVVDKFIWVTTGSFGS